MSKPDAEYWTVQRTQQLQVSREQASTEDEAIALAEEMDDWELAGIEAW